MGDFIYDIIREMNTGHKSNAMNRIAKFRAKFERRVRGTTAGGTARYVNSFRMRELTVSGKQASSSPILTPNAKCDIKRFSTPPKDGKYTHVVDGKIKARPAA